ncbi:hypothetical protein C8Q77DRAFT_1080040 [Trametes polyzona]|nr:hypothetical protein C8Q77DRAFT_1080040 [Trametes polyzona]
MLKRQRSTPSFVPDAPCVLPPADLAIDAFERVAKRRRQIAPLPNRSTPNDANLWRFDDTDGEEDVEGDEHAADRPEASEQAQRMEQAGEYRNVNTLLHDLHAEQRHRILFSSPLPPSHFPSAHHGSHFEHQHHPSVPSDKITPALSESPPHAHHEPHRHTPSFTISIPTKVTSVVDHVEVRRVTQRYEDTNRLLRSLFLSRRGHPDTENTPK